MQMQNRTPPYKSEHSNARYDLLKIKSNKELHIIPMQIALNNRKVQNGHVLLTKGQNEMQFTFLIS